MSTVERILRRHGVLFDSVERQIRYVCYAYEDYSVYKHYHCVLQRCFPHVVNLACKAMLSTITSIEYAAENAVDFIPTGPVSITFAGALNHDPIATVRSLIRSVRLLIQVMVFD